MKKTRKIWFYIPPKVHVLDLTGPIQVFYEANTYGAGYDLHFFSAKDMLISSAGLMFGRVEQYTHISPAAGDYIFIPGAEMSYLYSAAFKNDKKFLNWLRSMLAKEVFVCSICTGAFILAEAGLLNNKKCTTHWKRISELQKEYPKILALENILYTQDDHIYTSAGITSGIDLSLAIIEEHYGPLFTHKVARELLVYHRRSKTHSQNSIYLDYRNHINVGVHIVQDWLIENLNRKNTIEELASISNMSPRNLTRIFRKVTGISINEYIKQLRIEKSATLSNNPEFSMEYIAGQVGYSNARQLRRIKK